MRFLRKFVLLALAAPLLLIGLLLVANAYERHRLNQRMAYWSLQMEQGLPPGATLSVAQEFFRVRGVRIHCQLLEEGLQSCSGREDEQYGWLPTWHIRFSLEFSGNALVIAERIALGVGL
ncbi:hypothetical protein [Luteimonas sp. R10]|uniref:hypothetical protein n=1 Tax=Luteimonas sp. R10 TaxID=3108176 RepID=UPI0030897756|nr:hypothetical protein U3649_02630 [Luteimonas sp. R10]